MRIHISVTYLPTVLAVKGQIVTIEEKTDQVNKMKKHDIFFAFETSTKYHE